MTRPRWSRRPRTVAVVTVAVLLSLLLADRIAVWSAERKVRQTLLRAGSNGPVEARVSGFPYLLQGARGDIDDLEVTIPAVRAGRVCLREVRATVRGVDTSPLRVVAGKVRTVRLGEVRAEGLLTYKDLEEAIRRATLGLTLVRVSGSSAGVTLQISLVGGLVPLARIPVVADTATDRITLGPTPDLDPRTAGLLQGITGGLPLVPDEIDLDTVTYYDDHVVWTAHADDLVLRTGALEREPTC